MECNYKVNGKKSEVLKISAVRNVTLCSLVGVSLPLKVEAVGFSELYYYQTRWYYIPVDSSLSAVSTIRTSNLTFKDLH